ncbi:DNA mismatch repair protein MSH3 [Diplonema papillatum]|nr:DNA mismatch repair protein MSH3 [Diplonema papillatum]
MKRALQGGVEKAAKRVLAAGNGSAPGVLDGWDPPRTALEQQFMKSKVALPDTLIAVEVGYKYRFFGRDAEIAAEILGFYVGRSQTDTYVSCSFPVQNLAVHTGRLVNMGYKVAHLAQAETSALRTDQGVASGKLFEREVVGLFTKATSVLKNDAVQSDNDDESNNLVVVCEDLIPPAARRGTEQVTISVIAISLATGGTLVWDQFSDGPLRRELMTRLLHFDPVEIIADDAVSAPTLRCLESLGLNKGVTLEPPPRPPGSVRFESIAARKWAKQETVVTGFFAEHPTLQAEALALPSRVVACLGVLVKHLTDFHLEVFLYTRAPSPAGDVFTRFSGAGYMKLPSTTLTNLEVFAASGDQGRTRGANARVRGSLNWVVNNCRTGFGARKMRAWLSKPLVDIHAIRARHDAVAQVAGGDHRAELEAYKNKVLSGLPDVERILTKMTYGRANPREFSTLLKTVRGVAQACVSKVDVASLVSDDRLAALLKVTLDPSSHQEADRICAAALRALNADAAAENDVKKVFKVADPPVDGPSSLAEVAALFKAEEKVVETLRKHLYEVRKTLRIPNLEYKTVGTTEYLLDVPLANVKAVPKDWTLESSVAKSKRYHTPFIKEAMHKLQVTQDTLKMESQRALEEVEQEFSRANMRLLQGFIDNLAVLDCLFSLGNLARDEGWVRPEMVPEPVLEVVGGRHPVIDRLLKEQGKNYVPNDVMVRTGDGEQVVVITGPNMGGKSSYIRQAATAVLLAQIGSFVPAEKAKLGVFDSIHVRLGSHDSLLDGQSSFLVEISETSEILAKATAHSLLVLDELGRGTSTFDGIAVAHSILEYLVTQVRCITLFVTHYPELLDLVPIFPKRIKTCHMAFTHKPAAPTDAAAAESDDASAQQVTFLYKLVDGTSPSSFGMNVAKLAGIPSSIIATAVSRSRELQKVSEDHRKNSEASIQSVFALLSMQNAVKQLLRDGVTPASLQGFRGRVDFIDTQRLLA